MRGPFRGRTLEGKSGERGTGNGKEGIENSGRCRGSEEGYNHGLKLYSIYLM